MTRDDAERRDPGAGPERLGPPDVAHPAPTAEDGMRRRDFLSVLGATFAAASLPACGFRTPEEEIVPRAEEPEETTPGVAAWYASTCGGCTAACGVLVKTRDGRPIKLEGNPDHPLSRGGLCARGQATVLDLYDTRRGQGPEVAGQAVAWSDWDVAARAALEKAREEGGAIRVLGSSAMGPALEAALEVFREAHPSTRIVTADALGSSAILEAHRRTHGEARLPWYRFDRAKVIISVDADFLGTWISPVEFTKDWVQNRHTGKDRPVLSWHVQIEAAMSLTGANADLRLPVRPSSYRSVLLALGRRIWERLGREGEPPLPAPATPPPVPAGRIDSLAARLVAERGRSLVVSGVEDVELQVIVNALNGWLGNYGETLDLAQPSLQRRGDDAALGALIDEMRAGGVAVLVVVDGNPVHDHPRGSEFLAALGQVGTTISLARRKDETATAMGHFGPDHHPLESWWDAHPHVGLFGVGQPAIAPLFGTRSALETVLRLAGEDDSAHAFLRKVWRERVFPLQRAHDSFEDFWRSALQSGVVLADAERWPPVDLDESALRGLPAGPGTPSGDGFELVAYAPVGLGDGHQAGNPWLQELPDPIAKTTWGNHAALSAASARALDVVDGRRLKITGGGRSIELPALVQPGIPDGVVAIARGYGHEGWAPVPANYPVEKMLPVEREDLSGANVQALGGAALVRIEPGDGMEPHARTQTQDHLVMPITGQRRDVVREMSPEEVRTAYALEEETPEGPEDGHPGEEAHEEEAGDGHGAVSMWPGHEYEGHKWSMVIDLAACTGCSACVIGCQAENNVPVVGKAEIRKARDMQWIRIDRYYGGSAEKPEENPSVAFQPMLCQHCDHAPCETVCPVLATLHSSEGLNMQVYNRCVGTRYCANNCPYKVRRFNWFDYAHDDVVQNLVLNPDVTVRSRGVMEKCSFCVQRIAEAKTRAKADGRKLADGEVLPACMQSCPSDAIRFGDGNDPASGVARAAKDPRAYGVLDEWGFGPAVRYQAKVRQKETGG